MLQIDTSTYIILERQTFIKYNFLIFFLNFIKINYRTVFYKNLKMCAKQYKYRNEWYDKCNILMIL